MRLNRRRHPHACPVCSGPWDDHLGGNARACMRCHLAYNAIQRESLTAVAVARRNGNFPSLVGATCVECDRPAKIFDHRSYLRPLDVQPVCVYHNYHRGSTEEWNPGAIEHIVLEAA